MKILWGVGVLGFIATQHLSSHHSMQIVLSVSAFSISSRVRPNQLTQLFQHRSLSSSSFSRRRNIQLPLIDFSSFYRDSETNAQQEDATKTIIPVIPLPSSHLPDELCTILYNELLQLDAPIHKMLIEHVWSASSLDTQNRPLYGHVVHKGPSQHTNNAQLPHDPRVLEYSDFDDPPVQYTSSDTKDCLIGSIGCATEILQILSPGGISQTDSPAASPMVVLTRGSFRFIVKEIVQTFPFVVGIVDEIMDDNDNVLPLPIESTHPVDTLPTNQLIPTTLRSMQTLIDYILQAKPKTLNPLEKSILQDIAGIPKEMTSDGALISFQKEQAEELAALFHVFSSSLLDIAPTQEDRSYAVAIMAAEIASLDHPNLRRDILLERHSPTRLRLVLRHLLDKLQLYKENIEKGIELDMFYPWKDSGAAAVAVPSVSTTSSPVISPQDNEDNSNYNQDLRVGEPTLPSWAKQIKVGTMIEYYWNDEFGWCRGRVETKPVKILDELIITVRFDDGETHRLPFRGDEKVRWRPAR